MIQTYFICLYSIVGFICFPDINECDPEPCLNEGACMDLVNSYTCDCVLGYTGMNCQTGIGCAYLFRIQMYTYFIMRDIDLVTYSTP